MWKVTFDSCDVGNAKAVWNEGQEDEFIYEKRINGTDSADIKQFIAEAQSAQAVNVKYRSDVDTVAPKIASIIEAALNGKV